MNPTDDLIPKRHRKRVYALLALAAIVLGAWQAAEGDWLLFATYLLGSLGFGMATNYTDRTEE